MICFKCVRGGKHPWHDDGTPTEWQSLYYKNAKYGTASLGADDAELRRAALQEEMDEKDTFVNYGGKW